MKIVIMKVNESELREAVTNHINESLEVSSEGGDFHNYHRFFFDDDIATEKVIRFSKENPKQYVKLLDGNRRCTLLAGKVVGEANNLPLEFADYLAKLYRRVSRPTT